VAGSDAKGGAGMLRLALALTRPAWEPESA
jgi:hypothetical protein